MKEREERETKFPQKQGFTPSFRQKKKEFLQKLILTLLQKDGFSGKRIFLLKFDLEGLFI
jgi:hypothetical protein